MEQERAFFDTIKYLFPIHRNIASEFERQIARPIPKEFT